MDRDRFRQRMEDLRGCATILKGLSQVPERATIKDFEQVMDLLKGAATDIEELLAARPPGCSCRRVECEDSRYLDYAETCLHHGAFFRESERLKKAYAKAEHVLKNELRMKFITSALAGTATYPHMVDNERGLAADAIRIADEALRQIAEGAES